MVVADINTAMTDHEQLIASLQNESLYPHAIEKFSVQETHISSVILTGEFAYKFKKPVNFGFLDFSTLAKRKFFCEEELRLNQRLAPQLYLEVVPVSGTVYEPVLGKNHKPIEYCVKMKEFPQSAQLDRVLQQHGLKNDHVDQLASTVASFHQHAAQAGSDSDYGSPLQIHQPVLENFSHILRSVSNPELITRLEKLKQWCQQRFEQLETTFIDRKQHGFIREGHGDMHLRNIALIDNEVVLFDCLEFNPELRWVDTISDIAFLVMDLEDRNQTALAWRFLNRYLEISGDYTGAELLDYYKVYRALVRAKVDAIRLGQDHLSNDEKQNTLSDFTNYLELAEKDAHRDKPALILTRGVSGSGKSYYSQQLLEEITAIRIRSDVERKRLYPESGQQRYSDAANQHTYQYLQSQAESLCRSGYNLIIDATFLNNDFIQPFKQLAATNNFSFVILEFSASPATLQQRIRQRHGDDSEATVNIMQQQLQHWQELSGDVQDSVINIDTENTVDIKQLARQIQAH